MDLPIRPIPFDRRNEFRVATAYAFAWDEGLLGDEPDPDFDPLHEAERTRGAFDGDELVGTLAVYSLELTVPGASLPTAGTTGVTVRPTHRRRGLLRALMRAHFEDVRERGEPLAALWASESAIYHRFGYGVAAPLCSEQIDRAHTAFVPTAHARGRCRMIGREEAQAVLPILYERIRQGRPGMMSRSDAWWRHRILLDAPWQRGGATPHRRILYEQGGEARGYLFYRTRADKQTQSAIVTELAGLDGEAERGLYDLACHLDLPESILLWNQPADSPLSHLLVDPRRLRRTVRDALWVRPMDVAAALTGRAYAAEGRLTLAVRDGFLPDNEGAYALDAGPNGATCKAVKTGSPDVELDVADLGAAYLGGVGFRTLARAGRVRGSPEALARADAMFAWDPPPWNPEVF